MQVLKWAARLMLAATLGVGLLVLVPTSAMACSCAYSGLPAAVDNAETVVSATITSVTTGPDRVTYRVAVDGVYKGNAGETMRATTTPHSAACGVPDWKPNQRWLLLAQGSYPGDLRLSLCDGNTQWSQGLADQIAAITGPPAEPVAVDRGTDRNLADSNWTLLPRLATWAGIIVLGGLLVASLIAWVVSRGRSET